MNFSGNSSNPQFGRFFWWGDNKNLDITWVIWALVYGVYGVYGVSLESKMVDGPNMGDTSKWQD